MADKRRSDRNRTLKSGRVIFDHGKSVFDCLIRDMSHSGARLRFGAPVALPKEQLELLVVAVNQRRPVEVTWQRGNEAGVAFIRARA